MDNLVNCEFVIKTTMNYDVELFNKFSIKFTFSKQ